LTEVKAALSEAEGRLTGGEQRAIGFLAARTGLSVKRIYIEVVEANEQGFGVKRVFLKILLGNFRQRA